MGMRRMLWVGIGRRPAMMIMIVIRSTIGMIAVIVIVTVTVIPRWRMLIVRV